MILSLFSLLRLSSVSCSTGGKLEFLKFDKNRIRDQLTDFLSIFGQSNGSYVMLKKVDMGCQRSNKAFLSLSDWTKESI